MKALYLSAEGPELRTDYPSPDRPGGQALIRLDLAGICSTDLELIKGYYDFQGVLGHEFVGTVEQCDDPRWLGRRVVGSINLGCRQCRECASSGPEHCPHRQVLGIVGHDGAFAELLTLPEHNLLAVPDAVTDEQAVFTEPLAAALRIRDQIRARPSDRVAVVGPGRLGRLIAQVLALDGADVTLLGRRAWEPADAAGSWSLSLGIVDEAADNSFDRVVEATGNEAGMAHSLRLVRPRGTLVLKSTFAGSATVDLTKLVVSEIRVIGSRCGPFEPALRLLERDSIDVTSMIHGSYPLSEALAALEHAGRPGVLKILLTP